MLRYRKPDSYTSRREDKESVHPNAPNGGGGPGFFKGPRVLGTEINPLLPEAHPFSPLGLRNQQDIILASTEGRFFFHHPFIGAEVGAYAHCSTNISTDATRFATGLGLQENDVKDSDNYHLSSQVNAARHAIWQGIIASKYGADMAKEVGDAHEDDPDLNLSVKHFSGNNRWKESDDHIDLLNNIIGREIGAANPGASQNTIVGAVLDYYHNQGLWEGVEIFQEDLNREVSVVKKKLSGYQYKRAKQELGKMDEDGFKPGERQEYCPPQPLGPGQI